MRTCTCTVHSILKNLICKLNAWKMRTQWRVNWLGWLDEQTKIGWNTIYRRISIMLSMELAITIGIIRSNCCMKLWLGVNRRASKGLKLFGDVREFKSLKVVLNRSEILMNNINNWTQSPPISPQLWRYFFWKYCSENKLDFGRLSINLVISSNLIYCILFYSLNRNNSLLYISL